MMDYEVRSRLVGGIYKYISDIVDLAINRNKKLILWGCGKGGAFIRHLICDIDGRMDISYYIDDHMVLPFGGDTLNIYRKSLLWYLNKDEYIVILSIRRDENVEGLLHSLRYEKGSDYFDARSDIGGSYLEYLELRKPGVDFSYVTKADRPDIYRGEFYESKPFDHSSIDRVFSEIKSLPCNKNLFDIGCGKGQIILMAAMSRMVRMGGIDFNTDIVKIAKKNLEILQIDAEIIAGEATEYMDIEGYDIFFMYNPFGEESLRKVITNIKRSMIKNDRNVFLVYGNPFFHHAIMQFEGVKLYKQVKVNLYDTLLNIYRL